MFGYIVINKDELKIKDYNLYRSFYCGLCQKLKDSFGQKGQLSLSYDLTFFVIFLTALYEEDTSLNHCKCIAHPFEKHPTRQNKFANYAADMNLLFTYYKCLDDWNDEKKKSRYAYASLLKKDIKKLEQKYPRQAKSILENLLKLGEYEKSGEHNLDICAGYFGNIMAEMLLYREDEWTADIRTMGFFLGKFIYLMDAYDDMDKDFEKGNYNPLLPIREQPDFETNMHQILTMMMAECCKAFERLPIILYTDILRNILYSGVWGRYELIQQKRKATNNAESI